MVESFYTHVALVAVRSARRSVDIAGLAKFYLQRVRFDRHRINVLLISDRVVFVLATHRKPLQLLTLIFSEYLGDEPGVPEAYHQQHHLNQKIDYDSDDEQGERSSPARYGVVEAQDCPDEYVRTYVLCGF